MRGLLGRGLTSLPVPSNVRWGLLAFCWKTQSARFNLMKLLTVVMIVSSIYILFIRRVPVVLSPLEPVVMGELRRGTQTAAYWQEVDHDQRYEFDSLDEFFPDKILVPLHKEKMKTYVSMLQHSVKIVDCLPRRLTIGTIDKCRRLDKPPLLQHQHALEIVFPKMLRDMSRAAAAAAAGGQSGGGFDPLFVGNTTSSAGSLENVGEPIFHYVEAYPYHAVYCTSKSNNRDPHSSREDWTQRDAYWNQVAEHLIGMREWGVNMGVDFIAPASHPQIKPSRRHPFKTNYLQRVSFLSTDMDVSGSAPKDIVVPYLAERVPAAGASAPAPASPRDLLLFFSGGDNPKLGLRSKLAALFGELRRSGGGGEDVLYTLDWRQAVGGKGYLEQMASSKFCLIVRGDTSSSRRFFTAVASGCIPVIISDWLELPFSRVVDYQRFTLRFPEAVAGGLASVQAMLHQLRGVSASRLQEMRAALAQASRVLLFNHLQSAEAPAAAAAAKVERLSVLNPVTLTFVEALLARMDQCALQTLSKSPLCTRIGPIQL